MLLRSTNDAALRATLREAIFKGIPDDKGLYMPVEIPRLPAEFFQSLNERSFQETAFSVAQAFIGGEIPDSDLRGIVERSLTFPAPLVKLSGKIFVGELFHGPTLAFKDFGARFMSQTLGYFVGQKKGEGLTILVATSGDTGGAVASAFKEVPGIRVVILFPKGGVSPFQESQLTNQGPNIIPLEIEGTFDDCQMLVKRAFSDAELRRMVALSSANSINISRLIPQTFYYFETFRQIELSQKTQAKVVYSVPSGNFGNLTAGLFAKQMGLGISHFIAATNANDVVPKYLADGQFTPKPSVKTLSNAMDVGNPSNIWRVFDLYCSTWNIVKNEVSGWAISDEETLETIRGVRENFDYRLDPHGAVGYAALKRYQKEHPEAVGVVLETAHPDKFHVEHSEETSLTPMPETPSDKVTFGVDYDALKGILLTQ